MLGYIPLTYKQCILHVVLEYVSFMEICVWLMSNDVMTKVDGVSSPMTMRIMVACCHGKAMLQGLAYRGICGI